MNRWSAIGAVALLGLGAAWFFATFERAPVKEWVPPSGEARLKPFLAAERLAMRLGMKARELRSLPELARLPASGVVLLPRGRQSLDAQRIDALLAWAGGGGHLIVEAELAGVPDPLLAKLGLSRMPLAAAPKPKPLELPDGRRLDVRLSGQGLKGAVRSPRLSLGTRDAWQLVCFPFGKGLVTAAGSLGFARNGDIGKHDHAELFWALLGLSPSAELLVFAQPRQLSLWRFLEAHAAPALASAALLLALWLWRIGMRFGPVAPDAPAARRRLLDHLRASGRFFWARGLRLRLVLATKEAALRRIARAQPDFGAAGAGERAARLARLAGIRRQEAAWFLAAAGALRGAAFIQLAHVAQRVHAALDRGNRIDRGKS